MLYSVVFAQLDIPLHPNRADRNFPALHCCHSMKSLISKVEEVFLFFLNRHICYAGVICISEIQSKHIPQLVAERLVRLQAIMYKKGY